MDNKEILKYVNSKDIRAHLARINYDFSTLEAVWLIANHYNITLEEKLTAWQSVIHSMPDCEYNENGIKTDSFLQLLTDYISALTDNRSYLLANTPNTYYEYEIDNELYKKTNEKSCRYRGRFDSYEKCYSAMKKNHLYGTFYSGIIRMNSTADDYFMAGAEYNTNGDIINIFFPTGNEPLPIEIFFIDDIKFPTPFQKGDILYNPFNIYKPKDIFVISDYTLESGFAKEKLTHPGNVYGYTHPYHDFDGLRLFDSSLDSPSDYEYCPEVLLIGKYRAYSFLSDYLKGRINLAELLNKYNTLFTDELNKDIYKYAVPENSPH